MSEGKNKILIETSILSCFIFSYRNPTIVSLEETVFNRLGYTEKDGIAVTKLKEFFKVMDACMGKMTEISKQDFTNCL